MLKVLKVRHILYSGKPPFPDGLTLAGNSRLEDNSDPEIDPTLVALIQEYYELSKIISPTEAEFERLAAIVDLAQYDTDLSSFINEADHLIALELGLAKDHRRWSLSMPLQAVAEQPIAPNRPGRVKYQGDYWFAQLYQPCPQTIISSGQVVNIVGMVGDNFLVAPVDSMCS